MKQNHILALLFLLSLVHAQTAAQTGSQQTIGTRQYYLMDGRWKYYDPYDGRFHKTDSTVTVRYSGAASAAMIIALEEAYSLSVMVRYDAKHIRYSIPTSASPLATAAALLTEAGVADAEVGVPGTPLFVPTDAYGASSWWIPKIKADSAWDIAYPTSGGVGSSVILAIADGGVDLLHEDIEKGSDLYSNLWTNTGEIPADGIDNDNNLVIDDVHGCWFDAPTLAERGNPQAVGAWPFMFNANQHGTRVAGLAGAKTNNLPAGSPSSVATGMAGIAGGNNSVGVQMMGVRITDTFHQGQKDALKQGIRYAVANGAKIINLSWQFAFDTGINNAVQEAVNSNVLFVAASGNDNVQPVVYPASTPQVLAVGGTDASDYRWVDNQWQGANYGAELDIAAPSKNISSTLNGSFYMHPQLPPPNGFQVAAGTSNAAPMVSGVAAMMLHVNPCLTANNLQQMLKHTAVKAHPDIYNYYWYVGWPGHSKELGYGRVDAFEAVKAAKSWATAPSGDAYIKDFPSDWGAQPSTTDPNAILWESPDIWVRNQNDGIAVHQNAEYGAFTPVWVYVRVRNRSCATVPAGRVVNLYWNKAGAFGTWPNNWTNNPPQTPPLSGGIGSVTLGAIPVGGDTVVKIPWLLQNPAQYTWPTIHSVSLGGGAVETPAWHYCLLAVLDSVSNDPHHPNTPMHPVVYSNNIAQKNVWIIDQDPSNIAPPADNPSTFSAAFLIGHQPGDEASSTYEVHTQIPADRQDFFSKAQVLLYMDDLAWARWQEGGLQSVDMEIYREDERCLQLLSPSAKLQGIDLAEGEQAMLVLAVHFLTDMGVADEGNYALRIIQAREADERYVGGGTVEIRRYIRDDFDALAGPDKTINPGQSVTLNAADINEPAQYNWYNSLRQRLHSGKNWTHSPEASREYTLEVVTEADGYKDYDRVWVHVRDGHIQSVSPNPTSNTIAVQYSLQNVTSASLILAGANNNTLSTHPLNLSQSSATINMAALVPGIYTVLLVCDGFVLDAETVQKL